MGGFPNNQKKTYNKYVANIHNKQQEPSDINVLPLRILTNIFKTFKTQKNKIHIVLNIVTAL